MFSVVKHQTKHQILKNLGLTQKNVLLFYIILIMIYLYLANRLEDLWNKLYVKLLEEQEKKTNIYEPTYILIPNKNIEYWLKQKIAEEQNICMNYRFFYFESGIWYIYKKLFKSNFTEDRIDPDTLSLMIYDILQEKKDDLKFFRKFIEQNKDFPGIIYDLSFKLSELFFQYNFHNPKLAEFLNSNNNLDIEDEYERQKLYDQRVIYQECIKKIHQYNEENQTNFVLFFDYENQFIENIKQLKEKNLSNFSLFIFAFQFNNVFYFKLLKHLKEFFDIHYFQFILYDYKNPKYDYKAQEISYNNVELFKKITEIPESNIEYIPLETKEPYSLLKELQKSFIQKGISFDAKQITFSSEENLSLRFIEAPDKRSEIRAVIRDIQDQLLKDPDLKLNDIAILSPVLDEYFPLLRGQLDYLEIPYNIQDPSVVDISYLADAIITLCYLLEQYINNIITLKKDDILKILENPLFQKTHKLTESHIAIFNKFIESLNIYYEFPFDYYRSWEVALRRLRLGKFSQEIVSFKKDDYDLEILPYEDFEVNLEILEAVHRSLVQFIDDFKKLAESFKNPTLETYQQLEELIINHFNAFTYEDSFYIEKKVFQEFLEKLGLLKTFKILPNPNFLYYYFYFTNENIQGNINEYLFQGITISSLQPLRPIPFKRIYILGLNQENFPGKDTKESFNLIDLFFDEEDEIVKTNILKKTHKNIFIFYEIFFSARDTIILSYINKDIVDNRPLYPSFIYRELKDFVLNVTKNQNYVWEVPLTIRLKENKIFNNSFELYNTLLATYREDLDTLRKEKIQNNYLDIIYKNTENSIKEIYKKYKFTKKEIDFVDKKEISNDGRKEIHIDIKKLKQYLYEPLKYYFDKNQLVGGLNE